ncbi:MAG: transketolase family protein, partial [Clostridia bacterium]|nr:transketolase family protein [Clostridia bacterium]
MADKIATREAYGKALVALADKYPFVVLDADLSQATKTCLFAKEHPDRFFDCGIAEGNMMSVAAG